MFKNFPFVLICLFLFTAGTAVPAAPQVVNESHEVTVRLVLVDVIATDRDGNIVKDLTLDDFDITEGRKKIPLNSMDFIDFTKLQASAPTGTKSIRKKRFFVIFDSIPGFLSGISGTGRLSYENVGNFLRLCWSIQ